MTFLHRPSPRRRARRRATLYATLCATLCAGAAAAVLGCAGHKEELRPAAGYREARTARDPGRREIIDATPGFRIYVAQLVPLNTLPGERAVTGRATVILNDERGTATLSVDAKQLGGPYTHAQYLHGSVVGDRTRCPGPEADTNGDGIVDAVELRPIAGVPLLPLSTDLGEPRKTRLKFPRPEKRGRVGYLKEVSLPSFRQAMKTWYSPPSLVLERRTIVIYGVSIGAPVPSTVHRLPGLPTYMSVPVACGILVRVS